MHRPSGGLRLSRRTECGVLSSPADERQVRTKSGELVALGPLTESETADLFSLFSHVVATGEGFPHSPPLTRQDFESTWVKPVSVVVAARLEGRLVGGYYLKPNFVGKAAHIANAGYMVASSRAQARCGAGTHRGLCVAGPARRIRRDPVQSRLRLEPGARRSTRSSVGARRGVSPMP